MEILGDMFNFWNSLLATLFFILAYTWTTKTSSDIPESDHINRLQNLKLDKDGEIAWTGTSQWKKGSDVASASNLQPGSDGNYFDVTGTTGITQITPAQSQPGTLICLHFDSSLTITHDGDYIVIPGGSNLTVASGSEAVFIEYVAGKFRLVSYFAFPGVTSHDLGGAKHNADTLVNLNSKVSDATLDDQGNSRPPQAHKASHENGGGDEISVAGLSGDLADAQDPKLHATDHESGGGDTVDHNSLVNYASQRHRYIYISDSGPSGGNDGDVWLEY